MSTIASFLFLGHHFVFHHLIGVGRSLLLVESGDREVPRRAIARDRGVALPAIGAFARGQVIEWRAQGV